MREYSGSELNSARRLFAGSSSFLLENWTVRNDTCRAKGWALTEYPEAIAFTVNGRPVAEQALGLKSESLKKVFPFYPFAESSGFLLTFPIERSDVELGRLEIELCDSLFFETLNPWHSVVVPLDDEPLALPSEEQLVRTQGNSSTARYLSYGLTVAARMKVIMRRYFGKDLGDLGRIVDWGVGCGRVAHYVAPSCASFVGFDIDADNVSWCANHLPGSFVCNDLMPPLDLADSSVDLLYGISVFTHLTDVAARAWRDELSRVLKPGGACVITVHGRVGMARILDDERLIRLAAEGFDASQGDNRLNDYIHDASYYRATYQTYRNSMAFFSTHFDVVDYLPGANALLQDILVLRKPI